MIEQTKKESQENSAFFSVVMTIFQCCYKPNSKTTLMSVVKEKKNKLCERSAQNFSREAGPFSTL